MRLSGEEHSGQGSKGPGLEHTCTPRSREAGAWLRHREGRRGVQSQWGCSGSHRVLSTAGMNVAFMQKEGEPWQGAEWKSDGI